MEQRSRIVELLHPSWTDKDTETDMLENWTQTQSTRSSIEWRIVINWLIMKPIGRDPLITNTKIKSIVEWSILWASQRSEIGSLKIKSTSWDSTPPSEMEGVLFRLIYRWHITITVCLLAIFASSLVDMDLDRLDHLVGNPDELRNCLTVDALIPKFTFSGIEPTIFSNFLLFSWATTTPTMFPFSS